MTLFCISQFSFQSQRFKSILQSSQHRIIGESYELRLYGSNIWVRSFNVRRFNIVKILSLVVCLIGDFGSVWVVVWCSVLTIYEMVLAAMNRSSLYEWDLLAIVKL